MAQAKQIFTIIKTYWHLKMFRCYLDMDLASGPGDLVLFCIHITSFRLFSDTLGKAGFPSTGDSDDL